MKCYWYFNKRKCLILACALLGWGSVARAQTGSIGGVVRDATTGELLPGAMILIEGTNLGAASGLDGRYSIMGVPVGERELRFSYLGYETFGCKVVVEQGKQAVQDVSLVGASDVLGEVLITGQLEGQQRALNQQRTADNIKNVVSADLIGRFPDLNVAEALQRVPGVNITRDRGEGTNVSLRGTPAHFTAININGEQMPSTQDNGARNESLDLVPADQLASMEVVKAITSDMDGDAIGGSINLRTPKAASEAWQLKAEAGGGYNSLSQRYNGIGRLKVGKRWLGGKLGTLAGFSYFETDNEADELEVVWSAFGDTPVRSLEGDGDTVVIENREISDIRNQRTRLGATFTLDYQIAPGHELVFNWMYARRGDVDERNRLNMFLNESAGVSWVSLDTILGTELRRDVSLREYFSENFSYNLEGRHQMGQWHLDWGLYLADSRREEASLGGRFERGAANRVDLVVTNGSIYQDFARFRTINTETDFFDPFLINEVNRYDRVDLALEASNMVAKANLMRQYQLGAASGQLKTGVKIRRQTNNRRRQNDLYNYSDPNRVIDPREGYASLTGRYEDEDFLNGHLRFGSSIAPDRFRQFVEENERLFNFDQVRSNRNTFNDTYQAEETILAAYAMNRLQMGKLMVLAGLRFETNSVRYDAFAVNNVTGEADPLTDGTDYGFLLPNIHLKYAVSQLTNLRAAATWSYARANFDDLVPYLRIDEEGANVQAGNPNLLPGAAFNLDLMGERYLGNVGILSAGLFYKRIRDFQFTRNLRFLRPGDPFYETFPGYQFRQEQNGEMAEVYGLEINVQSSLSFLPKPLDGLGVFFNYTLAESVANTSDRSGISLPGQARHTGNAALSYDYKGFSIKASLNYNGSFLREVAGESRNDLVQLARLQLDLNTSLRINEYLRVFAEFLNLTNAPAIQYQGTRERVAEYAFFGWWNRFGLSFRL